MLNVVLYGFLADKYGKYHSISAKSPAEVIRAFCANFKEFKQDIIQDGQAFYKILAGAENRSDVNGLSVGTSKTIKLIPIVAGKGGLGKIIIGAALIYASIVFPGTAGALSGFLSSAASSIGFSLVLGGVSSLLFAPSKTKSNSGERPENVPSYAFAGAVNVTGQGNPVPLCYGRMRVGSQVVSTGLSVGQL
jgi:predicted phage tail protein